MGKPRIYGNNARLLFCPEATLIIPVPLVGIPIGEVEEFKAKGTTKIIKSRPAGFINEGTTLQYGGYDLSFKLGKVDWGLAHEVWLQDQALRSGDTPPEWAIEETIKHYNGAEEKYIYRHVNLFGVDFGRAEFDCNESIEGFAPWRDIGLTDTTTFATKDNLVRSAMYAAVIANRVKKVAGNLLGGLLSNTTLPGTTPNG